MSLTLTVDGDRWRAHLSSVAESHPGIVPVAKGNGYGFTLAKLARKTQWLADQDPAVDTLAVGTYDEIGHVSTRFDGSLLVLTPWRPFGAAVQVGANARLIHTVGRYADLLALLGDHDPDARYVLELRTSMRRHGFTARGLREAAKGLAELPRQGTVEGVALHLPLAQGNHLHEMRRLMTDLVSAGLPTSTVWVSHLSDAELTTLRAAYPDFTFRPRIGTALWLGDRGALKVTATVLDAHPVERGDVFGYRGRSAPVAGTILVVSGGTAHGIGLEAPTGDQSFRARAATLARGGLDAAGLVRSPYSIGGKQRLFAEPPHMQASMLFLPHGSPVPSVGDEVEVRVRYTATTFDRIVIA